MSVPRPLRLHRWLKVTPNRWNQSGTLAFQTGCPLEWPEAHDADPQAFEPHERSNLASRPPRIHSEGRRRTRARAGTRSEASAARQSRALKSRISAPEDSLRGAPAKASESGHLKRSFSSPPVASATSSSCPSTHHQSPPDSQTQAAIPTVIHARVASSAPPAHPLRARSKAPSCRLRDRGSAQE